MNEVRIVKDGIGSVGVIPVERGNVALIDGGSDDEGKPILVELSRRGLGPDAVTAILLIHGHIDHVASISLFPKAQVMALAAEVGLVEGTEGAHGPVPRLFPVKPTGVKVARVLHDGDTLMLGAVPVKVYAVPGHTKGSAAYLVNGVLFLGDAANVTSQGKVIGAPWVFSDGQAQDRSSLVSLERRLEQEGAKVPVPNEISLGLMRCTLTSHDFLSNVMGNDCGPLSSFRKRRSRRDLVRDVNKNGRLKPSNVIP